MNFYRRAVVAFYLNCSHKNTWIWKSADDVFVTCTARRLSTAVDVQSVNVSPNIKVAGGVFKSPNTVSKLALSYETLPKFALAMMEKHGNKTFLVNGETGVDYSFRDCLQKVQRLSSGLVRAGLQPGDRVTFCSFNLPEYILSWFAATSVGAVVTDINPKSTPNELREYLRRTQSKFLFVHEKNARTATSSFPNSLLQNVFVFGQAEQCVPYDVLAKDNEDLFQSPVDAKRSDMLHMQCSSGTTGLPKLITRSHETLIRAMVATSYPKQTVCTVGERTLLLVPLYHVFGNYLVLCNLREGCTVVTSEKFRPEDTLNIIQERKVTTFPMVPTLAHFLVKHPLVSSYDLSTLKHVICGAAPTSSIVLQELRDKLSLHSLRLGYGMTEMAPISIEWRDEICLTGCGHVVADTEVKAVCTETRETLPLGSTGEILARGRQIMTGYLDNTSATEEVLDADGWLHTGDIGHVTSEGVVVILDRLKDVIKVKGHQVSPAELEALLMSHPSVEDAAVVGVEDERSGQIPRAFVVLKNGQIKPKDLESFVAGRSSPEKHLTGGVYVLQEIPKSPTGKVLKTELRRLDVLEKLIVVQ